MNHTAIDNDRIRVTYRLACPFDRAETLARKIAFEQTVELPEAQVTDPCILEQVAGRVESVVCQQDDTVHTVISFNAELCSRQLSQLLILLYGNVSIFPGVRLVGLDLPGKLLAAFDGPGFGITGIRELTGIYGRPLLASAIKPRGISIEAMAAMAGAFARGGGDIIKDDQNLADDPETFKARVTACFNAVQQANEVSGRQCLYFPHISAPYPQLEACFEFVQRLGIKGVLLCPMVLGLDTARALASRYGLIMMAHPALTGSYTNSVDQGISHGILLGTLFRLAGADISVFPNFGGRFSCSRSECMDIRTRLLSPLGELRPAFPAPAGGMQFDNLPGLCRAYGEQAVFLIGGSLQGYDPDLEVATRIFAERIRENFTERLQVPAANFISACEVPGSRHEVSRYLLEYLQEFTWEARNSMDYKPDNSLAFKGVRRVELMGQHGEQTAFDLRYFEIEAGGYTSLEKHRHTHVIIAVRGEGMITAAERSNILRYMDIAYIAPLEVHQIRNTGAEPFGFFCIVDHDRDRPQSP